MVYYGCIESMVGGLKLIGYCIVPGALHNEYTLLEFYGIYGNQDFRFH
jgi:hypothetical protein